MPLTKQICQPDSHRTELQGAGFQWLLYGLLILHFATLIYDRYEELATKVKSKAMTRGKR
ncbi:hypothetical protein [uncultured Shewanella sp.]|uniref:hypothetical protein n=1 Tax=Shewanella atlantica TaxID=271099 RepID=UPI002624F7FC|nr:hypothetical protein [uncultured Shewanella sp.]